MRTRDRIAQGGVAVTVTGDHHPPPEQGETFMNSTPAHSAEQGPRADGRIVIDPSSTRSAEEIDAAIEQKINAAVAAAVAREAVDPARKVGVFIGPDGSITVTNVDETGDEPASVPDPVEFPAMYRDENRESLADSYYAEHLETHWGF